MCIVKSGVHLNYSNFKKEQPSVNPDEYEVQYPEDWSYVMYEIIIMGVTW